MITRHISKRRASLRSCASTTTWVAFIITWPNPTCLVSSSTKLYKRTWNCTRNTPSLTPMSRCRVAHCTCLPTTRRLNLCTIWASVSFTGENQCRHLNTSPRRFRCTTTTHDSGYDWPSAVLWRTSREMQWI
uniref:Uncharacterized protein n=1 Tax=Cacopsylla melanoneura TaxID=428564 RepID=A0A8D8VNS4_9HEMI